MISIREIEKLFAEERYEEASSCIREALQDKTEDDEETAEYLYYLFLADNRDYANIDLHDIVNEIEFNKALDLAVLRLRSSFTAEYNFYNAVDVNLRKYFAYASRGNVKAFGMWLDQYGIAPSMLVNNFTDDKEFLSNLDYIVTSRIRPVVMDLNQIALTLLYISTGDSRVLKVKDVLKGRALEIGTILSEYEMTDFDSCRNAYQVLSENQYKTVSYMEAEAKKQEAERSEREEAERRNQQREEELRMESLKKSEEERRLLEKKVSDLESHVNDLESKKDSCTTQTAYYRPVYSTGKNTEEQNLAYDRTSRSGCRLSIFSFVLGILIYPAAIIIPIVISATQAAILMIGALLAFILILAITGIHKSKTGRKSDNASRNNSVKGMVFGFISLGFSALDFLILLIGYLVAMVA